MIGNPKKLIQWLLEQDQTQLFEIEKHHEKRSNNANSFAWVLITQIGQAMKPPLKKEQVYLQMLEDYGQSMLIPVQVGQKPDGFFKYYKYETTSTINGKPADWYKVFKGSSDFDSREMSLFIDGIVQEAQNMEIETLPPAEILRLKEMWKQ